MVRTCSCAFSRAGSRRALAAAGGLVPGLPQMDGSDASSDLPQGSTMLCMSCPMLQHKIASRIQSISTYDCVRDHQGRVFNKVSTFHCMSSAPPVARAGAGCRRIRGRAWLASRQHPPQAAELRFGPARARLQSLVQRAKG